MKRLLWFRRDLRIEDNPLLSLGGEVLPLFIFDTTILSPLSPSDTRVSLIFHSVIRLKEALQKKGLELKIFWGNPVKIFTSLARLGFDEVVASGDYRAYPKQRDLEVSMILPFHYLYDTYIFEPSEILKADGTPYLVFTPFYHQTKKYFRKKHLQTYPFAPHTLYLSDCEGLHHFTPTQMTTLPLSLSSMGFEETMPKPYEGENPLKNLSEIIVHYQTDREIPSLDATSHLSVALRFGWVSVRAVLRFLVEQKREGIETEPFFRQLIFRDFYASLLYHFPSLEKENYKYHFKGIANEAKYHAFCRGETGVPLVDAGVRQLLTTGQMHNRVRMVCASFFTKDLLLPWQWGEAFFAQYLLDYDTASNVLSWQWSAGTGIDSQPYFRIFNPYLQSKKFDKEAKYIKKWIPQLSHIAPKEIHNAAYLERVNIKAYPRPIVKHKEASAEALKYFKGNLVIK